MVKPEEMPEPKGWALLNKDGSKKAPLTPIQKKGKQRAKKS